MIIFILLSAMLVGGIVFVLMSFQQKNQGFSIKTSELKTNDLKALVMFVSSSKKGETIDQLLAYQVLTQMSSDRTVKRNVWLIHSDISDNDGSSYKNTIQLNKDFKSENFVIKNYHIDNIFDSAEIFTLTSKILYTENLGIHPKNIACDCTAGTKLVTLGIALAAMRHSRLIYFKSDKGNASEVSAQKSRVY